jgi:DNA-binding CsgD family transcriptional regulator/PAS domain-containing protein
MNDRTFDAIVTGFYRAATGELSWDEALVPVQQSFGARAVILHTAEASTGRILSMQYGGAPMQDGMLAYMRDYHQIDPRRSCMLAGLPHNLENWWHCHEHLDDAFVSQDRCFQELLLAENVRYQSVAIYMLTEEIGTAFALELPASRGVMNADERESVARLGIHLRDALRAYQRIRSLMAQALAGHGLLNSYPYPMWLMDEQRHISFANPAAQAEQAQAHRVALRGERMALVSNRAEQRLTECLHLLKRQPNGASAVVDLRTSPLDAPVWLHLSVLVPDATLGAFGLQPQVLATLFDPQHVSALDTFALAQMFSLTPTEAKVAARLAEGLTAEQIGQLHGTTEGTVRSQIRQVLAKLGAQRVADVIRMLRQGEALWAVTESA